MSVERASEREREKRLNINRVFFSFILCAMLNEMVNGRLIYCLKRLNVRRFHIELYLFENCCV